MISSFASALRTDAASRVSTCDAYRELEIQTLCLYEEVKEIQPLRLSNARTMLTWFPVFDGPRQGNRHSSGSADRVPCTATEVWHKLWLWLCSGSLNRVAALPLYQRH